MKIKFVFGSFLIITALFHVIFHYNTNIAESIYGEGLFPVIRYLIDSTIAKFDISFMYLFVFLVLVSIGLIILRLFYSNKNVLNRLRFFAKSMFYLLSVIYMWFYWAWGFNYYRPSLKERIPTEQSPDSLWLLNEFNEQIEKLNSLRAKKKLSYLDRDYSQTMDLDDIYGLNNTLNPVCNRFGYTLKAKPPLRQLLPKGVLLHWSTSGIYWPFTGESNIDDGVHHLVKPVTIAHELAHAHGVGGEGDCNLIAYLACRESTSVYVQYAAAHSYFRYLWRDVGRNQNKERQQVLLKNLNTKVRNDMLAIRKWHNQYEDWFPDLRNKIYDSYLKSQGVAGGIQSYNDFVKLKFAYDNNFSN